MPTIKKVIEVTENGSTENGMIMNKRKSAIVEFLPRMRKKEFITSKSDRSASKKRYKYFGLWLNLKLNLEDQFDHIEKKTDFIKTRLGPTIHYPDPLWNAGKIYGSFLFAPYLSSLLHFI